MLKSYLKNALRNIRKNRIYSFLNILGLSVGITATFFLMLYVNDELSYDRFHENSKSLYVLAESFKNGDSYTTTQMTPYKLGPLLKEVSPAVEAVTRVDASFGNVLFEYEGQRFEEARGVTAVDSNFFEVFSFPLLQGNPQTVLREPNSLVISETKARQYFGSVDPIGKPLTLINGYGGEEYELMVTGIMKDMPENSQLQYGLIFSMAMADDILPNRIQSWGWTSQYTYFLLAEGHEVAEVESVLSKIIEEHAPDFFKEWAYFQAYPMASLHLDVALKDELGANSSRTYVYIFSLIGFFILLIACINYMNLATARAATRAKEVGLRKVVGARRRQLTAQFFTESLIVVLVSFLLAIVLAQLMTPYFQQLTGKELAFNWFGKPSFLLGSLGLLLFAGLLAGSYPAFFLSGFQPVRVLQGELSSRGKNALWLRRALVVLQFTLSIALIVGILVIYSQWKYLQNKDLGIDTEQILLLAANNNRQVVDRYEALKEELLKYPEVAGVASSNKDPFQVFGNYSTFTLAGQSEQEYSVPYIIADPDFFDIYGAKVKEGRPFQDYERDSVDVAILNEAALKLLGREDVLGSQMVFSQDFKPTLVGVVKDFHFESLHAEIRPMVFFPGSGRIGTISVKLRGGDVPVAIRKMEKAWKEVGIESAFSYSFFDESARRFYQSEARFLATFAVFGLLGIIIACLGIFGLASFSALQRSREVGIRKVLGASVSRLVWLLCSEFLALTLGAFLLAIPLAYLGMQRWLENFAYQVNMSWWMYILAGVLAMLIAFASVSLQSFKAARMNPAEVLKYE